MGSTKNSASIFDDDFEVTYEEEIPFSYGFDTDSDPKGVTDETVVMDARDYRTVPGKRPKRTSQKSMETVYQKRYDEKEYEEDSAYYDEEYEDDYDSTYGDDYQDPYEDEYEDSLYGQDDPYDDDYEYDSGSPRRKRAKQKSSKGGSRLLSPVKKTAKYGTKAIYRTARSVVRIISALITAGTFCVLAYNFWRGAAPYGDPQKILTDKNYALAAYAGVAALILLFELISFFWSLTKMKFREGRKIYKEDTGRGLFSFIFIYVTSYLSFLLCSFLPDKFESFEVLNGVKGALDVFGSLHNVLLGLCLAGAVSCLVRRHMN